MHAILHYHGKILETSLPPPVTTHCNTLWNSPVFRNNMIHIMLKNDYINVGTFIIALHSTKRYLYKKTPIRSDRNARCAVIYEKLPIMHGVCYLFIYQDREFSCTLTLCQSTPTSDAAGLFRLLVLLLSLL